MKLGDHVKYSRVERGLTSNALGALVGVDGSIIRSIERGASIPEDIRLALAAALKVNPSRLIARGKRETTWHDRKTTGRAG